MITVQSFVGDRPTELGDPVAD